MHRILYSISLLSEDCPIRRNFSKMNYPCLVQNGCRPNHFLMAGNNLACHCFLKARFFVAANNLDALRSFLILRVEYNWVVQISRFLQEVCKKDVLHSWEYKRAFLSLLLKEECKRVFQYDQLAVGDIEVFPHSLQVNDRSGHSSLET